LMDDFAQAFGDADTLTLLDIYAASEAPIEGITAEALADKITESGRPTRYVRSFAEAVETATSAVREGDMILTLGAGSVSHLGPMILEKLGAASAVRGVSLRNPLPSGVVF